jgi:hypothetical protein
MGYALLRNLSFHDLYKLGPAVDGRRLLIAIAIFLGLHVAFGYLGQPNPP